MSEDGESTLAERLGFTAAARVAVIHADDIGMCHASNVGSFAALNSGSVTCGSLMAPCPSFHEAVEWAHARPGVDLGVHLTLNSEWDTYRWGPVAGATAVPSLVDSDGFFYRTQVEVLQNATVDDVEREMRAQIDAVIAAGIDPTHVDSHMGTLLFPPLMDVYERMMLDYRLPGALMGAAALNLTENEAMRPMADALDAAAARLWAAGIPVLDGMDGDSPTFSPGEGLSHNEGRVANLRVGVTFMATHPSEAGPELTAIAPDAACREFELEFFGGELGRGSLSRNGIETVGMAAIRDLVQARPA
jgi:predicted glycoside hydrolase/deacetylase ChbG (UPF0249 family)